MDKSYWDVSFPDEKEVWLRTIGLEKESVEETAYHAGLIFGGIPKGDKCLEIGCGVGRLLKPASTRFFLSVGIDYSESLRASSFEYLKDFPSCSVILSNGTTIPFYANTFDFVFSYTVFHHMPTRDMVLSNLREIYRVLLPGKYCRIQTVKGHGKGYDGYVYPSAEAFWQEFKDIGFEKVDVELLKEPRDAEASRIWVTARKPK